MILITWYFLLAFLCLKHCFVSQRGCRTDLYAIYFWHRKVCCSQLSGYIAIQKVRPIRNGPCIHIHEPKVHIQPKYFPTLALPKSGTIGRSSITSSQPASQAPCCISAYHCKPVYVKRFPSSVSAFVTVQHHPFLRSVLRRPDSNYNPHLFQIRISYTFYEAF